MLLWLSNLPNPPAGGGADVIACLVGTIETQAALSTTDIQTITALSVEDIRATTALSASLEVCKKPVG